MANMSDSSSMPIDHQGNRTPEILFLSRVASNGMDLNEARHHKAKVASPQPDLVAVLSAMEAELEAARARIVAVEHKAEAREAQIAVIEWQAQALQAERDAAKRTQVAEREKAQMVVMEALKRTLEALQRAEKAETRIQQAKTLPGVTGWLVRCLTRRVLA